jgi:glycosyltransferase involved in cell wall biosynthesis
MKILLTADPELPVPPGLYGGIERIVDALIHEYVKAGHEVVLCAHPDSKVPCRLVPWRGMHSQRITDTLKNTVTLTAVARRGSFDVVHSFSRLAYMSFLFPTRIPKVMSYQREPSLQQIKKAGTLAKKNSLIFTGCSNYISNQIGRVATASTVYNCAPFDKYVPAEKVGEDAPLVFLGRIEDIKGTDIAVEVAAKSGRRLLIAGNIPAGKEDYFDKKIKPFLNDRIKYIGAVNDEQKNELLGSALALLMPIRWNEPFGIVMAEAMACGTPVLGFPFGSVPEVVEDGLTGYVCRDTEQMVARVADSKLLSRAGVRKRAEDRFSTPRIAGEYLSLYRQLIEQSNTVKSI